MSLGIPTTCLEMLDRWDTGQSLWSIELGGLWPSYEQAIQVTGIEMLRSLVKRAPDVSKWDDEAVWKAELKSIETDAADTIKRMGLSGAQFGAAINMATVFYKNGPPAAMKMVSEDRHIQIRREFP